MYISSTYHRVDGEALNAIENVVRGETFCVIPNYPRYYVSSRGRIYSTKTNDFLKASPNANGYYTVNLIEPPGSDAVSEYVHKLVAEAFCKKRDDVSNLQVHHKDGDKKNNRYKNLMWVTVAQHAMIHSKMMVAIYDIEHGGWAKCRSLEEVANKLDITVTDVRRVVSNKSKACISIDGYTYYEIEDGAGDVNYIAYTVEDGKIA